MHSVALFVLLIYVALVPGAADESHRQNMHFHAGVSQQDESAGLHRQVNRLVFNLSNSHVDLESIVLGMLGHLDTASHGFCSVKRLFQDSPVLPLPRVHTSALTLPYQRITKFSESLNS